MRTSRPVAMALALLLFLPSAAHAAPSTSDGRISVLQLEQMLDRATTDPVAGQLLTAYLAGIGEAAAEMMELGTQAAAAGCRRPMQMSAESARLAIDAGAGRRTGWSETAATPILVRDMLRRAGCGVVR